MATTVNTVQDVEKISGVVAINFWADWSKPCIQMNAVFDQLAAQFPSIKFLKVEAEKVPDVTEKYNVSSVPFFVILNGGAVVDQIEGANPPELSKKIAKFSTVKPEQSAQQATSSQPQVSLQARLQKLITAADVMLFMKGSPDAPQCGFSRKIVELLKQDDIKFSSFNILSDEEVRNGLKEFSNWPTYPQLYIDGKLVGGLDIVKELSEQGELKDMVPKSTSEDLNTRLQKLVNQSKVMLFMKGQPDAPECGFSGKIVKILNDNKVRFGSFNIFSDAVVREGLKKYSNWPTYPQLYVDGKLVGGLDIVKELADGGELQEMIPASEITA